MIFVLAFPTLMGKSIVLWSKMAWFQMPSLPFPIWVFWGNLFYKLQFLYWLSEDIDSDYSLLNK